MNTPPHAAPPVSFLCLALFLFRHCTTVAPPPPPLRPASCQPSSSSTSAAAHVLCLCCRTYVDCCFLSFLPALVSPLHHRPSTASLQPPLSSTSPHRCPLPYPTVVTSLPLRMLCISWLLLAVVVLHLILPSSLVCCCACCTLVDCCLLSSSCVLSSSSTSSYRHC